MNLLSFQKALPHLINTSYFRKLTFATEQSITFAIWHGKRGDWFLRLFAYLSAENVFEMSRSIASLFLVFRKTRYPPGHMTFRRLRISPIYVQFMSWTRVWFATGCHDLWYQIKNMCKQIKKLVWWQSILRRVNRILVYVGTVTFVKKLITL